MNGYPKHYNSKFDIEYARANFPESVWKPLYEDLLAEKKIWICARELTDDETGETDTEHMVVKNTEIDGTIKKYQYELIDDPNSRMNQLGYTENEINAALQSK